MIKKESNNQLNTQQHLSNSPPGDGESNNFSQLWEGVIRPTKVEAFEDNGKATHLVIKTPPPLKNNIFTIKK